MGRLTASAKSTGSESSSMRISTIVPCTCSSCSGAGSWKHVNVSVTRQWLQHWQACHTNGHLVGVYRNVIGGFAQFHDHNIQVGDGPYDAARAAEGDVHCSASDEQQHKVTSTPSDSRLLSLGVMSSFYRTCESYIAKARAVRTFQTVSEQLPSLSINTAFTIGPARLIMPEMSPMGKPTAAAADDRQGA